MSRTPSLISRRLLLAGIVASLASGASANAPSHSPRPQPRKGTTLAATGTGSAAPAAAPTSTVMPPSASELISQARLGGDLGYIVFDGSSGQVLESHHPEVSLPPASVAKAATALYALDRLGPNHRFSTRVLATGPIRAGVVQGDLVLQGSGDPSLDTDRLGELVGALRKKGITRITGRFIVDGTRLPRLSQLDAEQPEHVGYNPALSGLNLNYNRVHFEWKRAKSGWQIAMDARGKRFQPPVSLASARIETRSAPIFTYRREVNREYWTVASESLGKGGSRWLPTRLPERYTGEVFVTLCAAQGIRLPNPELAAGGGTVIAEILSAPLTTLLREMLRHSTNLTAEVIGLSASGARDLQGSAQAMNMWLAQKHGVQVQFVDHSGLGGASRLSPQAMARLMLRSQNIAHLLRPFPITEKAKGGAAQGPEVLAKTGTLNFVSGLSGVVPGHRPLVFAIFAADTRRRDGLSKAQRERPQGGQEWTRRARTLQARLLQRWIALYA